MVFAMSIRLTSFLIATLSVVTACVGDGATTAPMPDASVADSSTALPDSSPPDASVCSPGLTLCGGKCADLTMGAANCGSCGHDCGDAMCSNGNCSVATIANVDHPVGVAAAGTAVFWLADDRANNFGNLDTCPIVGCTPQLIRVVNGDFDINFPLNPHTGPVLLTDGTYLQWIAKDATVGNPNNDAYSCPIVGCDHYSRGVAQTPDDVTQLAVGGSPRKLFFRYTLGSARTCPFGTCNNGNQTNISLPSDQNAVSIAADLTNLYFDDPFKSTVNSCPIGTANCAGKSVSLFSPGSQFLASNGTILVAVSGGQSVFACATTGCTGQPTTLASNQPNITALVVDAQNAYFALGGSPGQANGEIRSCALPDCKGGVKSLATGLAAPNSLALSNNVLFWSNGGITGGQPVPGSIQKLSL